jgi:cytosine/adenosine deaminase-related metal-dependent hydrolase
MTNTTTRTITCAHLIAGGAHPPATARRITIAGDDIAGVDSADGAAAEQLLALPVLVNAHDHGRAIRTSSIGAAGKPLESWLHHLALFPSVDPYHAAVVSLSNSALGGTGVVMMHYTRAQGFTALPEEVAEVARAARDVGVRVGFAVSMKDRNPLVYGSSEPVLTAHPPDARAEIERRFLRTPLAPKDQIALADAVADIAAGPGFDVQYGPNGIQWCTDALLEAVAESSERHGRRVHMHLLETRYQRAWLDAAYPGGAVKHLDRIGLLTPRLTLAHCVWARPDELELLAERGVTIAVNTSSNLHLRSGIAPAKTMFKSGCRVALGIDSQALDDDNDALRELRLSHLLHAGTGFTTAVSQQQMLQAAFSNGRFAVTNSTRGGAIEPGAPADLLLLDWAEIENEGLRDDLDPVDLLLSRATARHIREVIVGGRTVVKDGRVTGVDLEASRREVLAQLRAGMSTNSVLAAALPALDRAIAQCLEPDHPCC